LRISLRIGLHIGLRTLVRIHVHSLAHLHSKFEFYR
jgi:hypothetical protein